MHVLLVDDREEERLLLEQILLGHGHTATKAKNGLSALDALRKSRFDLIVSDVLMPEMDGFQLCHCVKKDQRYKNIPFIFYSASSSEKQDQDLAIKLGAVAYLTKPLNPSELITYFNNLADHPPVKTNISHHHFFDDKEFFQIYNQRLIYKLEEKMTELEASLTRQKKIEEDLRISKDRYKKISSIVSDFFYTVKETPDHTIEFDWMDGAFKKITGYKIASIKNLEDWLKIIHPEDQMLYDKMIRDDQSKMQTVIEYRITTKRGETRWLREKNKPIRSNGHRRKTLQRIGAVQDITDLKIAELHKRRLITAVEQAEESIMITDDNGIIQYVNPAFEKITGFRRNEIYGKTPQVINSGKHNKDLYIYLWETIKKGRVWKHHLINRKKNGDLYEVEASISPIKNAKETITNYVAVCRDVTQEKKLEQQLVQSQKMEAIGTLAGGIAHDFNNILSAVIGFSELCAEEVAEGSQIHSNIQEILFAGQRARKLIHQILTFARQTDSDIVPTAITPILKESCKMLRASLPSTIDIIPNIHSNTYIMGDPTQIHQIIMNLCTNAGHAMMENGGTLEIALEDIIIEDEESGDIRNLTPGKYAKLTVNDTGYGISAQNIKRIFDPFFTTKKKGKGTGMGLAVVHGIVENMNGKIYVYSEELSGTTFKIFLPANEPELPIDKPHTVPIPRGTEHILFVDDEPAICRLSQKLLESLGYQVTTRIRSMDALTLFQKHTDRFDLVISDMTMPQLTGDQLARRMMEIKPDIPIIICTGFSTRLNEEIAKKIGIRAYLAKPLLKREIADTIRKVLEEV